MKNIPDMMALKKTITCSHKNISFVSQEIRKSNIPQNEKPCLCCVCFSLSKSWPISSKKHTLKRGPNEDSGHPTQSD